jgi:hypothetical protein
MNNIITQAFTDELTKIAGKGAVNWRKMLRRQLEEYEILRQISEPASTGSPYVDSWARVINDLRGKVYPPYARMKNTIKNAIDG